MPHSRTIRSAMCAAGGAPRVSRSATARTRSTASRGIPVPGRADSLGHLPPPGEAHPGDTHRQGQKRAVANQRLPRDRVARGPKQPQLISMPLAKERTIRAKKTPSSAVTASAVDAPESRDQQDSIASSAQGSVRASGPPPTPAGPCIPRWRTRTTARALPASGTPRRRTRRQGAIRGAMPAARRSLLEEVIEHRLQQVVIARIQRKAGQRDTLHAAGHHDRRRLRDPDDVA